MIYFIQARKYPLRFLLYLEWILLAIIIACEVFVFLFNIASIFPRNIFFNIFFLFIFGIIGLKLPSHNQLYKIIYTGLEFGLIIIASFAGGILLVPLLYIILIARNCVIFRGINRYIVSGLAIFLSLVTQLQRIKTVQDIQLLETKQQYAIAILASVLTLGIGAIFMQMAINALLNEFQSRQKLNIANEQLAIANAQLSQYALKVEELATLEERNRIARDIHDSVGHALTVLNLHLEAAVKIWQTDPEEATEFLTEAKQLGSNALKEVRQSISTLRADPLAGLSLEDAIVSLAEDFQPSSNISPSLEIDLKLPIKPEVKIAIYRIIQEAFTNIFKHAEATEVKIMLKTQNQNQISQDLTTHSTTKVIATQRSNLKPLQIAHESVIQLIIHDNGKGFKPNQNTTGFGLQSMRDRTLAIGGTFNMATAPNSGCKITATFPI
ncbi:sensor histidine kinase [Plectonema cf. radiosum LEGE 06105]|uniref:histidine kinase n=2 Tax=Plectonema TaxID=1183 RepID=A0A8J7EZA3_9CYAN|nr:sensor histidine kinase [Plectonema cf. radiosum LEGE 06105]